MKKVLIVYYSLKGETYSPSGAPVVLEKGHTAAAAEMIQESAGGDLFEIETVKTYERNHGKMILEAKREFEKAARPQLKKEADIRPYDIIFLGFPNWWNTMPMPVFTFLESQKWSGKKIIPFVTSGGSGFGNSLADLSEECQGACILKGKAFLGHLVESSGDEIRTWAKEALKEAEEYR